MRSNRAHFIDEILYERLHDAEIPVSAPILRGLCPKLLKCKPGTGDLASMYGSQFIDLIVDKIDMVTSLGDLIMSAEKKLQRTSKHHHSNVSLAAKESSVKNNNPSALLSFESRLENFAQKCYGFQSNLQLFYENRVASLDRYIAFCVMFHTCAKECQNPWLCAPWDIARSQSNLRVATTASPVPHESEDKEDHETIQMKKLKRNFAAARRGYAVHF